MHTFWSSVFILPSRVLLDIEQIMQGFLWCQGSMLKGRATAVRLKLLSCRFKKSKDGVRFTQIWDLPDTIFV
ncbi:hypothetical protein Tco_0244883 [Tanacetum coccineum]